MKSLKPFLLLFLISFFTSCAKENLIDQLEISGTMPGKHIMEMGIDNNNDFFFVTSERDTSVEVPLWASYIPAKSYLSKRKSETSDFEVLDDKFIFADEIIFDKNNNLWARNGKTIFLREGKIIKKILELTKDDGLFNFFAVDKNNNIWAGGYTLGLYKIDSNLNVKLFTPENSSLPKSSMTNIHIDNKNNIWIAMDNNGVLKISDKDWVWYNPTNSAVTPQRIWCLTTDKNDNLWIGTGFDSLPISLMKFDGLNWQSVIPLDDKNSVVTGAIRKLYSDGDKLYVITEQAKNMAFYKNQLLTFDGKSWTKNKQLPEDDGIADMVFDDFRSAVWVRTLNKGIFKLAK
jgi:ligand-binding sensor domain-containing protein